MPVKPIPEGFHTITPYLTVQGVPKLLDFLQHAFGATETERISGSHGKIAHAEVTIGDSKVMIGEARDQWKAMPTMLYLYVEDTDAAYRLALAAGGTSLMEPINQYYGDRNAGVQDPCGNQ